MLADQPYLTCALEGLVVCIPELVDKHCCHGVPSTQCLPCIQR